MRKRFEQQLSLNIKPIEETYINVRSRDSSHKIAFALLEIYKNGKFNEALFEILEDRICVGASKTGRPGMDLWQIFVLAQFRLGMNLNYDRLHAMALNDRMLRTLLGIESTGFNAIQFEFKYQTILDNVGLLSDDLLKEINGLIVSFGHEVFKKKETELLSLKTDSFVVQSNVHFPTDYNLLWDSVRKSLDFVEKFIVKYPSITGWRKLNAWRKEFKNSSRRIGQISGKGGKNKVEKLQEEVRHYTVKAGELVSKIKASMTTFPVRTTADVKNNLELTKYIKFTVRLIDLLDRRILQGEVINHQEKIFSIFETYTEWINKGKSNPNVELGKKIAITTDQFNLIVDYRIMEHESDSETVIDIASSVLKIYKVGSWSFDKGYWHHINKELLSLEVENVIMPKKGKCNKVEKEEERKPLFKKIRNQHSAVESNINELEHRGLNRCPDKGFTHFKQYIGLGICAYNLHKIGAQIRLEKIAQKNAMKAAA